ncbi:MAG: hypothetical protein HWD59_11180 [Coxiellaceae bacterium]|nr:MAG: hypothetical protein HWD59_11180 [Coxiellaceae bacterium]
MQDEAIESKQTLTQALTKAKDEFEAQICALKNAHANEIKNNHEMRKLKITN